MIDHWQRGLLAAGLLLGAFAPGAAGADPLVTGTHRVLVVAAASASDPELLHQRRIVTAMGEGARERDIVVVEAVGDTPRSEALRRRFSIDPAGFAAVLVGKDGGVKLRSTSALGPDRLFPLIDAMPMRQAEMRRRRP